MVSNNSWTRSTLRALRKLFVRRLDPHLKLVSDSGLFDSQWYLDVYPDVAAANADPLRHYLMHGGYEGRNPNPFFHSAWYLEKNIDVVAAGVNPLLHYILHGEAEGRWPCPTFNPLSYSQVNPEVAYGSGALLHHYLVRNHRVNSLMRLNEAARIYNSWYYSRPADIPVTEGLFNPLISIILPTYNSNPKFLRACIESVLQQGYANWELCVVDDGSTSQDCKALLEEYEHRDDRIKIHFSGKNGGIARASRLAVDMSEGEYISFLDHDDILARSALQDIVDLIENDPSIDYVYTDHAMINDDGMFLHPAFKPSWSPEFLLSTNYIVHFKLVRSTLVKKVDGFRDESHVIQDLDLTLRLVEAGAKIRHLPLILYFWRVHSQSVASGTSAKPSIERLAPEVYNSHLERRGIGSIASVEWPERFRAAKLGAYKLKFAKSYNKSTTVIVLARPEEDLCWRDLRELAGPTTKLKIVFLGDVPKAKLPKGVKADKVESSLDLVKVVQTVSTPHIVFIRGTARMLTQNWLNELVGYLDIDDAIGLVGGKVLDNRLRVIGGGSILLEQPQTIDFGHSDDVDGHWLCSQITSNVEGVSSNLLAVRKADLLATNGLEIFEYGDDAGVALGLEFRRLGLRAVYNPWSRIVDSGKRTVPPGAATLLRSRYGAVAADDRYYNPNFSLSSPFVYRCA